MFHKLRSIHIKWHQKMKKQTVNHCSIPLYCCVNIDDGFGFRNPYQTEKPFHPPNPTNQETLWSLFMRLVFSKYYSSNEWLDPTMEVPFLLEPFFCINIQRPGEKAVSPPITNMTKSLKVVSIIYEIKGGFCKSSSHLVLQGFFSGWLTFHWPHLTKIPMESQRPVPEL